MLRGGFDFSDSVTVIYMSKKWNNINFVVIVAIFGSYLLLNIHSPVLALSIFHVLLPFKPIAKLFSIILAKVIKALSISCALLFIHRLQSSINFLLKFLSNRSLNVKKMSKNVVVIPSSLTFKHLLECV